MKKECPRCHKLNSGDVKFCGYCATDLEKYGKVRHKETKYFENVSFEKVREWLSIVKDIEIYGIKTSLYFQGASVSFLSKHNWIINQMEISYYCDNPKSAKYDMVWGFGYDELFNIHDGMNTAQDEAYDKAGEKKVVYAYSRKAPCANTNGYQDNCCLLIVER